MKKRILMIAVCFFTGLFLLNNQITFIEAKSKTKTMLLTDSVSANDHPFENQLEIVKVSEDGLAGSDCYVMLVDKKGNEILEMDDKCPYYAAKNGYIVFNPITTRADGYLDNGYQNMSSIYTTKGKVVKEGEPDVYYGKVSKSGYVFCIKEIEDLDGIFYQYFIENLKTGEVIEINSNDMPSLENGTFDIYTGIGDIFLDYVNNRGNKFINIKTGETNNSCFYENRQGEIIDYLSGPNYRYGYFAYNNLIVSKDLKEEYRFPKVNDRGSCAFILIGKNKVLANDGSMNGDFCGIYDFNGNLLKNLVPENEDGDDASYGGKINIKQIIYYKGVYYIKSENGFIYTLDDNFNYIAEPTKTIEDKKISYSYLICTAKGMAIISGMDMFLIDKDLKITKEYPKQEVYMHGLSTIGYTYKQRYFACRTGSQHYIFDIKTGKKIQKIKLRNTGKSSEKIIDKIS